MGVESVLASIDAEIAKLQRARNLLAGSSGGGSSVTPTRKKHHTMSEEGKRRIAEAQKRRWAKVKSAGKK